MRALVSGAGGFLGRYVVDRLLQRGHSVRAILRPASLQPAWNGNVEIFRADLRVYEELASVFDGIDVVFHLAAATSGGEETQFASSVIATERFLGAMAESPVKRLVHVSSLVVYDWAHAKGVMDENTPLLSNIYTMGAYTIAKVWQERVVFRFAKSNSWDVTIMRPGFIWGPRRTEIAGMGRRIGRINLMFGPFTRLPLSHVANCADSLVSAAENQAAIGECLTWSMEMTFASGATCTNTRVAAEREVSRCLFPIESGLVSPISRRSRAGRCLVRRGGCLPC
jgi:nucleoside-diphosphate-sugar epimerase